ncbi:glycosyltransferase family 4 protein [Solwaraspora sp. WMMD1047]|uniref:glycosyltransferase family 4 protein n=1 Tax=Solwaraspora sp. WMMD1047 TaxID=3016102 RepID=UPI002416E251|nr:glycosyltransferase family 4 protein [Solwaraspora sp. WMMD1047]MDG4830013.1 glycosyltransferase family 4 protein [Solwaraspora sp. WMMD1047]
MTAIAFVLASWRPDAPAGMERAVAATAAGLRALGHHPVIITADPTAGTSYTGIPIAHINALHIPTPTTDDTLRTAINQAAKPLQHELLAIYSRHQVDIAIYVDGLWGLGRVMPTNAPSRRILAIHVVGHDADLHAALARHPTAVIAPSTVVLHRATARGYDTTRWRVVPNPLLTDPAAPDTEHREHLRQQAPIKILARLGPEKGVHELLTATPPIHRPTHVALADAGFEPQAGDQTRLLQACRAEAATHRQLTILPGLPWRSTAGWLADASAVIVPSLAETFGLVALEALSGGTPVIAYDVDNLPALIGQGGVVVPRPHGPGALWRAAHDLLADPVTYGRTSRAGYYLSRDYRPAQIADLLVKVVS